MGTLARFKRVFRIYEIHLFAVSLQSENLAPCLLNLLQTELMNFIDKLPIAGKLVQKLRLDSSDLIEIRFTGLLTHSFAAN